MYKVCNYLICSLFTSMHLNKWKCTSWNMPKPNINYILPFPSLGHDLVIDLLKKDGKRSASFLPCHSLCMGSKCVHLKSLKIKLCVRFGGNGEAVQYLHSSGCSVKWQWGLPDFWTQYIPNCSTWLDEFWSTRSPPIKMAVISWKGHMWSNMSFSCWTKLAN